MPDRPSRTGRVRGSLRALPVLPLRSDRGSVTAETAVVLPVLVAVTLGLVWMVTLALAQVRVVDAARESARAFAREEPPATALELGRRVGPPGSRITFEQDADTVRVHVVADVKGPGGLFGFLPGVDVSADAVAAREGS